MKILDYSQEKKGIPLLGDEFPEMNVQTTHGIMELPKAFSGNAAIIDQLDLENPNQAFSALIFQSSTILKEGK